MELTILHLFPDFMSLYGEYANVAVLRRYLEILGVKVSVRTLSGEDRPDFSGADLIYMGAGTERKQKLALEKLLSGAGELETAAADGGALLFFTGSAMETLGTSITDAGGKVWQGLGLADFTTVETDKRSPGDVVAVSAVWDAPTPIVGFMNKCSTTHGITTPLCRELTLGFGNEAEHGAEGYASGNIFGTHITGPVLVKNPQLLHYITGRLFGQRGWPLPETMPVLSHQQEAYDVTVKELQARIK